MITASPVTFAQQAQGQPAATGLEEIIVTASKREESLQSVPMSVQALDTRKLDQLNITQFEDYVKFTPSVSFQANQALNGGGGGNLIYMRGVADGNTSAGGPTSTVGMYLDEQPITDIRGALDVHIYDVARIEVLPGPQGTLYGASSEAGTLRIITNQPSTAELTGAVDLQGTSTAHGGLGHIAEGFLNIPLSDKAALRVSGFAQHDAGYIDNVPATRTFATSGATITNEQFAKNNFNDADTYGGRAALKVDLDDTWTVTPSVMAQAEHSYGLNAYEPGAGYLKVERFGPDERNDRWVQAAMTITGKISDLSVTYAGAYFHRNTDSQTDYTDYSVFYDDLFGSGARFVDDLGNIIPNPTQEVHAKDRYDKFSNELRVATAQERPVRFVGGLFQQEQVSKATWAYAINQLATADSVAGFPNAIFLLDQRRVDRDLAAFGEVTVDLTEKLSVLGGVRVYDYRNGLEGYYGFASAQCISAEPFQGAPCLTFDKHANGSGETHKLNATYRFDSDHLAYFTYSTGFRPGGINRNPAYGPYGADHLNNFEVGWKTGWFDNHLHWNGALYYETWNNFQYSFQGPNGTSIYQSGPSADVRGLETALDWALNQQLNLSLGGTYNDSKISRDFCGVDAQLNPIRNCAGQTIQVADGTPLPYSPKFKGSLTARYGFNLFGLNAHVQGALSYRGSIPLYLTANDIAATRSGSGVYRLGSFATTDLLAGVNKNGYRFEFFVENLFDTHGALSASTSCPLTVCGTSSIAGVPQALYVSPIQPRTLGIKIGKEF